MTSKVLYKFYTSAIFCGIATTTYSSATRQIPRGKLLGFPTGKICQRSGQLFFSANDGRVSDGTAVTSNIVTTTYPF